ncbi:MAG: MMPL family transporter [Sulfolobaceae archaeon]|nr:MMPL family transporter [Sulfolobaceae archaeon]
MLVYEKLSNDSPLNASREASLYVFKDPFVLLFSFNNYSNASLVYNTILHFDNYSYLVYLLTGKEVPNEALISPKAYALKVIESKFPPPPISLSNFHRGNEWLFLIEVPKNESLTSVEQFIQEINGTVTGHLPVYAQSAYYTKRDLEIIDIVTVLLVTLLLILLLRSLVPILLFLTSSPPLMARVPPIDSGLHLSFEGQSRGSETPSHTSS